MAQPRLLLNCDRYTEGAVVAPDGRLYFSMTQASTISFVDPRAADLQPKIWARVPGPNGHAVTPEGTHVVMSSTGAFLRLDESGRITSVIATEADGELLTYPNDVALDSLRGGFYATDSGYKTMPKRA
ncbi:MAG TPA: SMP-30/gluconolactonase/LRE family protein, partial [Gemmatimonadaceae bacterium]